jgi:hypothetical protein
MTPPSPLSSLSAGKKIKRSGSGENGRKKKKII